MHSIAFTALLFGSTGVLLGVMAADLEGRFEVSGSQIISQNVAPRRPALIPVAMVETTDQPSVCNGGR